ncbi:Tat (twin-arginine translocation) pathway signal sequence [Carboxydocella sporoproducens DSM 16521]|uniref:Tat (Twin-arginine translocation) pathway signal sequence n=2 Tax=Carboxydocella TaxID=178898 RepID=A0A1T4NS82_9FIRM|nr:MULTISPECIES: 4Fe-4S dicluster domain-containing protein [Carboxydocella]AVX20211.1 Tat (twin-arginine translocation) pathway signal sequence [Carboxydocella thermautotrophica]SJZ81965.1 Tat (twin-arginine translocation) pathway signal sequence [Carboxydocella sporoproducens DSM 16521]
MKVSRREFLKRSLTAGVAGAMILSQGPQQANAASGEQGYGTVIDLTKCTGCGVCVDACRNANQHKFPEPKGPIPVNWPTGKFEDWSKKRSIKNRLTPYNWTYIQKVKVKHQGQDVEISIPRRCMHCDNPPCANLCPFGVNNKTPEGAVVIDENGCFGGAKCQAVCPWHIPQRQGGVGIYMKVLPGLIGGGVMYKCDLCLDRVKEGKQPACVEACPHGAISFGPKEEMRKLAHQRAEEIGGYIYGEKENGGTSTFYVSAVPFEEINKALIEQGVADPEKPGKPAMPVKVKNASDDPKEAMTSIAIAPVAGLVAAGITAYKTLTREGK